MKACFEISPGKFECINVDLEPHIGNMDSVASVMKDTSVLGLISDCLEDLGRDCSNMVTTDTFIDQARRLENDMWPDRPREICPKLEVF